MARPMEKNKTEAQHFEELPVVDEASPNEPDAAIDPLAEKKLVRKIDLYLMPALWVLMVFSYIVSPLYLKGLRSSTDHLLSQDRSNLGNARVAGMYTELDLNDQDYYYAVVTFQVGYVIAGTPSK